MNAEEFAAQRRDDFVAADDLLRPATESALQAYANGEADWADNLIKDASDIWESIFHSESPNADANRFLPRFQESLRDSLEKTAEPTDPPSDTQLERVTLWVGTYTINDATYQAASARGARYKRWVTMHDNDVRPMHVATDGQTVRTGATFNVGGYALRYPGEPVGPAEVWINCRCVMQSADLKGAANMGPTTFAMDQEVIDEVDEDLPDDELEDDEEEITEVPVHGVLAPEGVPTGDGRQFGEGALTNRELPLPIAYQLMSSEGHLNSVTVGRIDEVFRQGNEFRFRGALVLTKEHTPAVIEGIIDGTVRGISVDVDDVEMEMGSDQDLMPDDGKMPLTVFSKARVAGVTIVPIPAFQEAYISLGHEFADELDAEALAACAACAEEGPDDEDNPDVELGYDAFRNYTAEERREMAKNGEALPDGSYPIKDEEDLRNAVQAIGRASDPSAARAHIKKRAKALGLADLIPEEWAAQVIDLSALTEEELVEYEKLDSYDQDVYAEERNAVLAAAFAPGTHDGPGWITHPIPTGRIRRYWVSGKGAAKIRWGVPGDFNRCRRQLAKYIANPAWLAGACSNMHKEALGIWPGMETGRKTVRSSGEAPSPIFTLVASGRELPAVDFSRPDVLDGTQGVIVDGNRVYGYIATWKTCHIGISGICTAPPKSYTDYSYFLTGVVETAEGTVRVGQITMDTGHASLKSNAKIAAAHYDNTGAAVADITAGEDDYGIWFAGELRSTATEDQIHALRASGRLSGDWRTIGGALELVAALAVNVPGFPIPHALAASAQGVQTALVAAGVVVPPATAPAVTASATDPELIAGIVRTAIDEYRHAEKREAKTAPLRASLRQKRIDALRLKTKE